MNVSQRRLRVLFVARLALVMHVSHAPVFSGLSLPVPVPALPAPAIDAPMGCIVVGSLHLHTNIALVIAFGTIVLVTPTNRVVVVLVIAFGESQTNHCIGHCIPHKQKTKNKKQKN